MRQSPWELWREDVNDVGCSLFEEINGWKRTTRCFKLEALAKAQPHGGKTRHNDDDCYACFDHAEFYKATDPPYRAACIVAHNYGSDDSLRKDCTEVAAKYDLIAHILSDKAQSWWAPRMSITVAFTRPGIRVLWPQWKKVVGPEPASESMSK